MGIEEKTKTPNHFEIRMSNLGYADRDDKKKDSIRRDAINILFDLLRIEEPSLREITYHRLLGRIRQIRDYPRGNELREKLRKIYLRKTEEMYKNQGELV